MFNNLIGGYKFTGLKKHLVELKIINDFNDDNLTDFDMIQTCMTNLKRQK